MTDPSEVDRLADAFLAGEFDSTDEERDARFRQGIYAPMPGDDRQEAIRFARAAAAVGARTALEDAAEDFATTEGVEATAFANDNVEAVQATENWLRARAATYTPEQEDDNR